MKSYFFILATFVSLAGCQNQDVKEKDLSGLIKDSTKFTSITWVDSLKDIGTIEAGKKTEIQFRFRNTGTKPLFIVSAEPGCGCTVADYPKEAIAPGAEGVITAAYNITAGTTGDFRKNIHVTTNTNGSTSHNIYFYGSIRNPGDTTTHKKPDSATLKELRTKLLKRNLLLKPTKN